MVKPGTRRKAWIIAIAIQTVFIVLFIACLFTVGVVVGDIIHPGYKAFAVKCGIAGSCLAAIIVLILYFGKNIAARKGDKHGSK